MKTVRTTLCLLLLSSVGWLGYAQAGAPVPIAIIIDDLGYHSQRGQAIVTLPAAITCAIIPDTPHAERLARLAQQHDKEIIIHLPMENSGGGKLESQAVLSSMSHEQFNTSVRKALLKLPQARGVNNHMGSLLTEKPQQMAWLMKELKQNRLFFVDSRTSAHSVAEETARQHGLATAGRDIFLDNVRDLHSINTQFNRLLAIAKKRGHAIAIGHPYPETLLYLENVLPLLEQAGVEVVPVSQLLDTPLVTAHKEEAEPPVKKDS